jgi:hypothetical protein
MKKMIFVILAVFTASQVSAFDLLYRLDTTMTKAQVEAQARNFFKVTRPSVERTGEKLEIFSFDKEALNNQFPQNLTKIELVASESQYAHFENIGDMVIPNVSLFFSNNILFAIQILYSSEISPAALIQTQVLLNNRSPTGTIIETNDFGNLFTYYVLGNA